MLPNLKAIVLFSDFKIRIQKGLIQKIDFKLIDPVMMDKHTSVEQLLSFYMGKNTPDRQEFIINNLKVELDTIEEEA